jgi:hypothetical protein
MNISLLTKGRVRDRVGSCGICGGPSGTGAGIFWTLRFPLPSIPSIGPHSSFGAGIIGGLVTSVIMDSVPFHPKKQTNKTHSVALSPQANYTGWATATCRRNWVPTFVDRGVSRGSAADHPRPLISVFWTGAATFLSTNSSFILSRAEWTPFQTHCYSENLVVPGIEPGISGLAARNSDH